MFPAIAAVKVLVELLRIILSPNVFPLSLLALNAGSFIRSLSFTSHYDMYTVFPSASIDGSIESNLVELLRLIFGLNVLPSSVDALNIISKFPLVLLLDHVDIISRCRYWCHNTTTIINSFNSATIDMSKL